MFDSLTISRPRIHVLAVKVIQVVVALLLIIGGVASHRAYFQVRELSLNTNEPALHVGSEVTMAVVTSGRTPVDVRLELVQGSHAETFSVMHVRDNELAFFDPRKKYASQTVAMTSDLLSRFQAGAAQLKATAIGREQWTRLPPPTTQEVNIEIRHE